MAWTLFPDVRALGILALSWNLLVASLPAEVSSACIRAIDEAGLPPMTVRGDATGECFEFSSIFFIHPY